MTKDRRRTLATPRARRPRSLRLERLEARLVLSGIATVGVYDENVIDPNTVDYVATGSSINNTDFTTQMATAFAQDSGGVMNADYLGQVWSYGVDQDKTITVEPASGEGWGVGTGYHISGDSGFATSSPFNTLTLNFSLSNGAPNEHIVSVGVTALSITGRDYGNVTATAQLISGNTVSATRHIDDPTTEGDTFYGLAAPANDYITSLTLSYDGPVNGTPDTRLWFDDLGFITAPVTTNDRPPVATNDAYTATAVTPTTFAAPGVLANDTDPDAGQTLTAVLVSQASHGGVSLNPDGSFTYTPATGFSGSDSFTYEAYDGQLDSNVATVNITVPPPTGSISGTLWGDVNGDGVRGTGDAGLAGRTVFLDQNQNGKLDPGEASTTTAADGSYTFTGLAPGTYYVDEVLPAGWIQTTPVGESAVVIDTPTQTVFNFNELASPTDQNIGPYHKAGFTFNTSVNQSTIFTVYGSTDTARYSGSPALTAEWWPATISLTQDDGAPFTISSIDLAEIWSSIYIPTVTFYGAKLDGSTVQQSFTLDNIFPGFQTFDFTGFNDVTALSWYTHDVNDAHQFDNVTVQAASPLNDTGVDFGSTRPGDAAPVASNDAYTATAGTTLTVAAPGVLSNDTDPNHDPLTAVYLAGPAHGTLSLNFDGSFTYIPTANFVGTDSFTYEASDGLATSAAATVTLTVVPSGQASLIRSDTTTEGNWIKTYGAQGYDVVGEPASLPSYATVTPSGQSSYTWASSTSDPRALQVPGGTGRIAATWYASSSFKVDVNLTDGQSHDLELYFDDWDTTGRSEQVQISDATTGAVLSTQSISSFHGGIYLDYQVSGHIVITITRTAGTNAVLSGLFLDPTPTQTPTATASFLKQDATTQGTWINTYGAQGYDVVGEPTGLPSYATVTPSGQSSYTWASSTSDVRALQVPGGTGRIAATWYASSSFKVDVNLTDGQSHDLELYFDDWDTTGRSEQVQISDATTGAVLSTQSISSFHGGIYLDYQVSGHIVITITRTAGTNAVLSGLFLDPIVSGPAGAATLIAGQSAGRLTPQPGTVGVPSLTTSAIGLASDSGLTADPATSSRGAAVIGPAGKPANRALVPVAANVPRPDGTLLRAAARRLARQSGAMVRQRLDGRAESI